MKFISKEEINLLPEYRFQGEIILIQSSSEAREAAKQLLQEVAIGFDTETRPAFSKGESYNPALLQLATVDKAYLFRLKDLVWPEELVGLLENEAIRKVGVNIKEDVKALQPLQTYIPRGFIDLAFEARLRQIENQGLRPLAGLLLQKRLLKGTKLTNWERRELTPSQLHYAASDAVVSLLVYQELMKIPEV